MNKAFYNWLGSEGYTGSLSERLEQWTSAYEGGVTPLAPSFSVQPSFDAGSYTVGDTITFDEGTAGPSATLAVETLTLGGVDKSGELSGTSWDSTGESAATIALRISATNSGGTTLSNTINVTLVAV